MESATTPVLMKWLTIHQQPCQVTRFTNKCENDNDGCMR